MFSLRNFWHSNFQNGEPVCLCANASEKGINHKKCMKKEPRKRTKDVDALPLSHTKEPCEAFVQHIGEETARVKNNVNIST